MEQLTISHHPPTSQPHPSACLCIPLVFDVTVPGQPIRFLNHTHHLSLAPPPPLGLFKPHRLWKHNTQRAAATGRADGCDAEHTYTTHQTYRDRAHAVSRRQQQRKQQPL
ncbi:hypothetical protein J4Q44_G00004430 [Coregonus suidteri]|uniref:Uncharacterized protein n=1 Tax=Coregonus suidteri TaxID=861788 RepID=A0AAN8MPT9_9TELE